VKYTETRKGGIDRNGFGERALPLWHRTCGVTKMESSWVSLGFVKLENRLVEGMEESFDCVKTRARSEFSVLIHVVYEVIGISMCVWH